MFCVEISILFKKNPVTISIWWCMSIEHDGSTGPRMLCWPRHDKICHTTPGPFKNDKRDEPILDAWSRQKIMLKSDLIWDDSFRISIKYKPQTIRFIVIVKLLESDSKILFYVFHQVSVELILSDACSFLPTLRSLVSRLRHEGCKDGLVDGMGTNIVNCKCRGYG